MKCAYEIGAEEELEVPAGKFKAFKQTGDLDVNGQKMKATLWWARDTGIVQQAMDMGSNAFVLKLTKFEKGK